MSEQKYNNDVNQVLKIILEQYPKINQNCIELFTKIQYPIAVLELRMREKTFEDFDIVQLTVLKLVNAGCSNAKDIADLTGLGENYIQKTLDLLRGYGHITETGVTELGKESLNTNQKITCFSVKQRFQADALTGDLLRLGEQIRAVDLDDKENIKTIAPIAPHVAGVSKEKIQNQLSDPQKYKKYQGDILNVNVESIDDIQCIGLYYVDTYMLKPEDIDTPFIFANYFDSSQKGAERFRWRPLRLPDREAGNKYGFSKSIPCYEGEASDLIKQLYKFVAHRACWYTNKKNKNERPLEVYDIKNVLRGIYNFFDYSYVDIDMDKINSNDDSPGQIVVTLNAQAFTRWDNFVFQFLEYYNQNSGFLYCKSKLNGLLLNFNTTDEVIISCSKQLQKMLDKVPGKEMLVYLDNKFKNVQEGTFINFKELESMIISYDEEMTDAEVRDRQKPTDPAFTFV